jgi:hypothetical protein
MMMSIEVRTVEGPNIARYATQQAEKWTLRLNKVGNQS